MSFDKDETSTQSTTTPQTNLLDYFFQRRTNGFYDRLTRSIEDLGPTFLGNVSFKKDFVRSRQVWSRNQVYRFHNGAEFTINLFGEIAHPAHGTATGASGSIPLENAEGELIVIDDSTRVKHRLVLSSPTHATPRLDANFTNQIATLHSIREYDEAEEEALKANPLVFEWTKASGLSEDDTDDLIMVNLGFVYGTAKGSSSNKPQSDTSRPKKRLRRTEVTDVPEGPTTTTVAASSTLLSPATAASQDTSSNEDEVRIGALYDPHRLPDFGGPQFQLVNNRLLQHDVRDIDGKLIPPWQYWDKLRPGTSVLVNATLHCFVMQTNGSSTGQKRDKKFYQINAKSVRVIADSDVEAVPPSPPSSLAPASNPTPTQSPAPKVDVASAYSNFVLPSSPLNDPAPSPIIEQCPADNNTNDAKGKAVVRSGGRKRKARSMLVDDDMLCD